MTDALKLLTPWIALITAIVAGYWTFRNQIRLKSFELLLDRRNDVLKLVEQRIRFYRDLLAELEIECEYPKALELFCRTSFHDSLILFHQAKGVALGPLADALMETYWVVCSEVSIKQTLSKDELRDNVSRRINDLAAFYGFAHSRISSEIESLSLSPLVKLKRMIVVKEKLKANKSPNKGVERTR